MDGLAPLDDEGLVAGQNAYVALDGLSKAHLNAEVVFATSPDLPAGTVIAQRPAPGSEVRSGTVVEVTLSQDG